MRDHAGFSAQRIDATFFFEQFFDGSCRTERTDVKAEIEARAAEDLEEHGMLETTVDPVKLANDLDIKVYNASSP